MAQTWRASPRREIREAAIQLTYCAAGETPGWEALEVIDLETGARVDAVVEVNTAEGWLIRLRRNEAGSFFVDAGQPDEVAKERLTGSFEIRGAGR